MSTAILEQTFDRLAALNEVLAESLVDLELAAEDKGWKRLGVSLNTDFSPKALKSVRENCRIMAVANPLIKQGLAIRSAFVWGQGCSIDVKDATRGADGKRQKVTGTDVNSIVQAFLDRPEVQTVWSGEEARDQLEHALGTDGEYYIVLDTDATNSLITPIIMDADEVEDIIRDPENRNRVWYYKRVFTPMNLNMETGAYTAAGTPKTIYYPHVDYRPTDQPKTIGTGEVRWDQPVVPVSAKKIAGSASRGVPDAYAAIPWASASKEYLENWAVLMKSLARFAWRNTAGAGRDRVKKVAAAHMAAAQRDLVDAMVPGLPENGLGAGGKPGIGQIAVTGPDSSLEAIPKSGATIDAGSGLPLQAMAAAGMGVPVTLLNGNPGDTGARAVADTMTGPMMAQFQLRRSLHAQEIKTVLGYLIDKNIEWGELDGTSEQQGDRLVWTLKDGPQARSIDVHFPDWDDTGVTVLDRMKAVQLADGIDKLPPVEIVRLALQALKVRNIDEIIDDITDKDGNYIKPDSGSTAEDDKLNAGNAGGYDAPPGAPAPVAPATAAPAVPTPPKVKR